MKKIIILLMSFMMAFSANAQTKAIAESTTLDNTYVTLFGGTTTPLTFDNVFPLNGVGGLKIGKEVTPVIGFNLEGACGFGSARDNGERFTYHNIVREIGVGLNSTLNWSNLLCGYNPNRVFTLSSEVGINWIHGFNNEEYGNDVNDFGAKTGLIANFGLGKTKTWNLFVEPAIYWDLTENHNGVKFDRRNAQVGLFAGVTVYPFKNAHGTHHFVKGAMYDPSYVDGLNDEINRLREDLAKKPTEKIVEKVVTTTNSVAFDKTTTVFFAQNSSELTNDATTALNKIANGASVDVTATASPEGTDEYNKTLSDNRAKVVADYLTSRGVNVRSAKGLGVTGSASNRVAVVVAE